MHNILPLESPPFEWWRSLSNKDLNLIIFVTEQCNFRCIYCYEDFKLGKLSPKIEMGIKNLIVKRIHNLENLSLSFFGGEPLLNKDCIIRLSAFSQEICKESGVKYSGTITTNGYYLDEKTFEQLISLGVYHYQITLDGDKKTHDELRPTIKNKSTFDRIFNNILTIKNSVFEFDFVIRINVSDSNFESAKSLIHRLSPILKGDSRFKFHFHPIFGHKNLLLKNNNIISQLEILLKNEMLIPEGNADPKVCYAAKFNSYSIRANGIVQMCTVALNNEMNNLGNIAEDGTLNIDTEKLKKWVFAEDKECPLNSLAIKTISSF